MEFIDSFDRRIGLSDEQWNHIIDTHPEIKELIKELEEALIDPELIKRSLQRERGVVL